jgi:hypothetical protein
MICSGVYPFFGISIPPFLRYYIWYRFRGSGHLISGEGDTGGEVQNAVFITLTLPSPIEGEGIKIGSASRERDSSRFERDGLAMTEENPP